MTSATIKTVITPYGAPGIEIYFPAKPDAEIIGVLKAASFRWHSVKKCWYNRDTEDARKAAESIGATEDTDAIAHAPAKTENLWERTRTDAIPAYGTENALKDKARKEREATRESYDKIVAAHIRKHLRAQFPEVKFSVTSDGRTYLNVVDIRIVSSPYAEDSEQLKAVLDYAKALHRAYDADDGDHYADYGAHHDLYGSAQIYYDYKQKAQSEEVLSDIADFEAKKAAAEKQAEEEFMRRVSERVERDKREAEELERLNAIREAEAEEIRRGVIVEDLTESEQIALVDLLELTSKCDHLEEAEENPAGRD
ncbi:MAG: LPD29 domain-containing protein, partial [Eubacteriales bacterium]